MENKFFKMFGLDGLIENAQGYVDSKLQLMKLELQEKLTKVLTVLLILIIVLFLTLMMLAFFSLALGFYLNSLFNSSFLGFLLMGFIFIFMIIAILMNRKNIHKIIKNIAGKMLNTPDYE